MLLQSPNAADAVLRAQATAFTLVLAIQIPFLVAIAGTAHALRRPGMRAYTLVYAALSLSWTLSAVAVAVLVEGRGVWLNELALAASLTVLGAMWCLNRIAAAAVAGVALPSASVWIRGAVLAVVGSGFAIVVPELPLSGMLSALAKTAAPRPVILLVVSLCALDAWRTSRHAERNRDALQLVAFSFLVQVLRQTYGVATAVLSAMGHPVNPDTIVFVQAFTTALHGVVLLAAMIVLERAEMAVQTERTRATELRLERAQRLESLGRMAGGISHDFANVLLVIQISVESALSGTNITEVREHLADAESAVDRATGLTRQLALFARQQPAEVTSFVVVDRLTTLDPILRRLAGTLVAFTMDHLAIEDATIAMDASQFDQIFLNLVVNARDAMPTGGSIAISGRVLSADRANTHVLWDRFDIPPTTSVVSLEVSDSGSGISADVIERIFEPFYSTKGDAGTGLGLATVLSVVRSAGGAIGVRSAVGEGSTFVVQLPLVGVGALLS